MVVVRSPCIPTATAVGVQERYVTWLCRAFLESTHKGIQAYPAPPCLPILPNHGLIDESWTLLPVTGVPDHLEKHHPNVDRDLALGKAAGSRRGPTILVRHRSPRLTFKESGSIYLQW